MEDEKLREVKLVKSVVHEHQLVLNKEEEQNNIDGNKQQVWCCKGCAKPISEVPLDHYYYCCQECDFFLHKACAELPLVIAHPVHKSCAMLLVKNIEHPTTTTTQHRLLKFDATPHRSDSKCDSCDQDWHGFTYRCSMCGFTLDFPCALAALLPPSIAFGGHQHRFTLWAKQVLFSCNACGTTHENKGGFPYLCTECQLWIHQDCASLSNSIKHNSHIHPLTLTCYFPRDYTKLRPTCCEICSGDAESDRLVYRCEGCRFSAHVNCTKSETQQQSMDDQCETEIENQVIIHPTQLPVKDISIHLVSQFFKKINLQGENQSAMEINHFSHDHPLTLSDGDQVSTSSNEDRRCEACTRPISDPFYVCAKCKYFMHKSCSELPTEMKHPFHPDHTLVLVHKATGFCNIFNCNACTNPCNGFAFRCASCNFHLDLTCSSISGTIVHETHEHPLVFKWNFFTTCRACNVFCDGILFGCVACGFNLHIKCALLTRTIRHRRDEHPLTISYCLSINQPEEYICDTCEKDVDPNFWFYYCKECDDPLHPGCISNFNSESNILFGYKINIGGHPHPLTLARKTRDKPPCDECGEPYTGISFHCEECKFNLDRLCATKIYHQHESKERIQLLRSREKKKKRKSELKILVL